MISMNSMSTPSISSSGQAAAIKQVNMEDTALRSQQHGRLQTDWHERIGQGLLVLMGVGLFIFLLAPVGAILIKSIQDRAGNYAGLQHFIIYIQTPALQQAVTNTLLLAVLVTALTIPCAFLFAYALTRSKMPGKSFFRAMSLIPILAPSLLPGLSFIQWFGNQGLLKSWMGGVSIYGLPGMVMSEFYCVFPHALMIIAAALTIADARLYEVAETLGTSRLRRFLTITLPGAKYGLVSAALVAFTSTVSDFGVPKVIGGNFNVLSVDVYKLVIGQQDFNKGAVVSLLLLLPSLASFAIDIIVRRKLQAQLCSRAVMFKPRKRWMFDSLMFLYCALICLFMLAVLGMAVYTSLIKLWPYNLTLSLHHYSYGLMEGGILDAYFNSLKMASLVTLAGVTGIFGGAYLLEKTRGMERLRSLIRMMVMLPMGIPGLVLGLGYILFFNAADNPFNFMYHSMAILVVATVVHYYTSSHMTAVTALKAIDNEFEAVSLSLKVPFYKTFFRVTVPLCLPAILDIGRYLFITAMTTVSAVVFLYSPDTTLASVAILNLEEAGDMGPAAAMASLIVATSALACLLYALLSHLLLRRMQSWRQS